MSISREKNRRDQRENVLNHDAESQSEKRDRVSRNWL